MDWEKFVNAAFDTIGKKVSGNTPVVVYANDFLKSISNLVTELKSTDSGMRLVSFSMSHFWCLKLRNIERCIIFRS